MCKVLGAVCALSKVNDYEVLVWVTATLLV